MSRTNYINWICKKPIFLGFIIVVFLIILLAGIKYLAKSHYRETIKNLEQRITSVRSKLESESVRQYEIDKMISIIELYNQDMMLQQKYKIADELYSMTQLYPNLNTALLTAFITYQTEGSWDPAFENCDGAMGLFALLPVTGMLIAPHTDIVWTSPEVVLKDAVYNIRLGSFYLSTLITTYDVDGGIIAFKVNEKTAAHWQKSGKKSNVLSMDIRTILEQIHELYSEQK